MSNECTSDASQQLAKRRRTRGDGCGRSEDVILDDSRLRYQERQVLETIFEIGLKAASPKMLLELMPQHSELNVERLKSHLQKSRLNVKRSKQEFVELCGQDIDSMCKTATHAPMEQRSSTFLFLQQTTEELESQYARLLAQSLEMQRTIYQEMQAQYEMNRIFFKLSAPEWEPGRTQHEPSVSGPDTQQS